jgi:16S rRNA (cytidine1402-2'-O)-methyltransferase
LQNLQDVDGTLLLFESSHRILGLLQQLQQYFPDRQCVIAKELTKLHEQFLCGDATRLLDLFAQDPALTRGEFVVLIDNSGVADERLAATDESAILRVLLEEVSVRVAARIAARLTGGKKNDLYQLALRLREPPANDASD